MLVYWIAFETHGPSLTSCSFPLGFHLLYVPAFLAILRIIFDTVNHIDHVTIALDIIPQFQGAGTEFGVELPVAKKRQC